MAIVAALACIGLFSASVVAAPDDLDPAFGSGGIARQNSESRNQVTGLLLRQPDGKLLVTDREMRRFNADGTPDTTFGVDGTVGIQRLCDPYTVAACHIVAIALQDDGKIVVAWSRFAPPRVSTVGLARFVTSGALDITFGAGGISVVDLQETYDSFFAGIALEPDGGFLLIGDQSGQSPRSVVIRRFLADGKPDTGYGVAGRIVTSISGIPTSLLRQADGKMVIGALGLYGGRSFVARLDAVGQLDPTFGDGGIFHDDVHFGDGGFGDHGVKVAIQPDGKLLAQGSVKSAGIVAATVVRMTSTGVHDFSFGSGGAVMLAWPGANVYFPAGVSVDSRQRIVMAFSLYDRVNFGSTLNMQLVGIARLTAEGAPDTTFAPQGATTLWSGWESMAFGVSIQAGDRIVVSATIGGAPIYATMGFFDVPSTNALFQLVGGDGSTVRTVRESRAVEYFHAGFGHYFVTASPPEIATLDTFPNGRVNPQPDGWARTGKTFRVWAEDTTGLSPVCRFFSGQTFAPRSSHFYTPYAAECSALRQGGVWEYEGTVFDLGLPSGPAGQGTCSAGSAPLYRLYNNGQGGAPNHRYTNDIAVVDQMTAQGWVFEGEAQTKVFACIPPAQ